MVRFPRTKDPAGSRKIEREYEREIIELFLVFKREVKKSLELPGVRAMEVKKTVDPSGLSKNINYIANEVILRGGKSKVEKSILEAYLQGSKYAHENLKGAKVIPVDEQFNIQMAFNLPLSRDTYQILAQRNLDKLDGITSDMSQRIKWELSEGMLQGEGMDKLAKRVNAATDIGMNRARTMARTETQTAVITAAKQKYAQYGVTAVEWITARDERVCDVCGPRDGKVFGIEKAPPCPAHPNCLLPDTLCEAPEVVAGTVTTYRGPVIELVFAPGNRLTVTPNHLILTPYGFAAAKHLREGDYVFYCPGFERVIPTDPNNNRGPSRIQDIIESLSESGSVSSVSMPAAPEDFHGDAINFDSNVKIIRPDGFLGGADKTSVLERRLTFGLNASDTRSGHLFCGSSLAEFLKATAYATDGGMSSIRETSPFFRWRISHPDVHCFATPTLCDSLALKPKIYRPPIDPDLLGDSFYRHTGIEKGDNLSWVDPSYSAPLPTPSGGVGPSVDSISTDIKFLGGLFSRFPGIIEPAEIVRVNITSYHGKVYDLQTLSTLLFCNSVIVSNCRCALAPSVKEV